MFAFEIPGMRFSLPAGGAVKRHRFVSVNSDSKGTQATATTPIVGVAMNEAAANEVLEIADGIVMVEAGAAITAGAAVYADADGKAAASGTIQAGIAITGASGAGEIITVKIN